MIELGSGSREILRPRYPRTGTVARYHMRYLFRSFGYHGRYYAALS